MTYTPGPWWWDKNISDGGAPLIFAKWRGGPAERSICMVQFENGSDDPEVHSNARLIAAAPDMYEALIEISQLSAGGPHTSAADGFNAVWHTLNKAREIADAALSKATGEDND